MAHLTRLIKKDQPFFLGVEVEIAFQFLKASFTIVPLLIDVNLSKPFILEMNTFNFAIGAILSQLGKNNFLHHVGSCFRKFFPVESNYEIYDKKLLAIMDAFEECHHLLKGAQHEIIVYSYHKNL
jgi:hypothetical protein